MKTRPQTSYFMHRLLLPSFNRIIIESIDNIYYCKADDSYSRLFLECGKYHLTTYSLKDLEKPLLPYYFIRCHRSYIVNIEYVKEMDKRKNLIILSNGAEIPVSQTYRKNLVQTLVQTAIHIN
ncbi:MAG TPA: LytTR family DNA-binding domain-containing protein [Bacteroidales bacterium]